MLSHSHAINELVRATVEAERGALPCLDITEVAQSLSLDVVSLARVLQGHDGWMNRGYPKINPGGSSFGQIATQAAELVQGGFYADDELVGIPLSAVTAVIRSKPLASRDADRVVRAGLKDPTTSARAIGGYFLNLVGK